MYAKEVFILTLFVHLTNSLWWKTVPGVKIVTPNGELLASHELRMAVPNITFTRYEVCLGDLRPGVSRFQIHNKQTNCSTPYDDIFENPITMFSENCATLKPRRDEERKCYSQNTPGPRKLIIAGKFYLLCGRNDQIRTTKGSVVACDQEVIPFDGIVSVNGVPIKPYTEVQPLFNRSPLLQPASVLLMVCAIGKLLFLQ